MKYCINFVFVFFVLLPVIEMNIAIWLPVDLLSYKNLLVHVALPIRFLITVVYTTVLFKAYGIEWVLNTL